MAAAATKTAPAATKPTTPATPDVNQQLATLTKAVTDLAAVSKANAETLAIKSRPQYGTGRVPANLFGNGIAPHAREGEDSLSSRPYSFKNIQLLVQGQIEQEKCKVEVDIHERLYDLYVNRGGYLKATPNSFLVPLSAELVDVTTGDAKFATEIKSLVKGGPSTDPSEVLWYAKKHNISIKDMSWIDESLGGSLVPPPVQMELIELLRNNTALLLAGATEIGMPPNGRAIWPRQTAAAQGQWLGEGQTITESDQATGDLILSAKKAAAFTTVNNELFKFGGINVEQFVRNDLTQVLALLFDKAGLEGIGSNFSPKGLINYANITTTVASTTGANGNTVQPQDIYTMLGQVFGQNAKFSSWVMRPEMWAALQGRRWSTISAGDGAGGFIWGLLREPSTDPGIRRGAEWHMSGYTLVQSTNVSNTRAKGSASNLTYILGGDFPDLKMAMSGVVEISLSTQGDIPFTKDQTRIKAVNYCDIAPAHEASFVFMDTLLMQ